MNTDKTDTPLICTLHFAYRVHLVWLNCTANRRRSSFDHGFAFSGLLQRGTPEVKIEGIKDTADTAVSSTGLPRCSLSRLNN